MKSKQANNDKTRSGAIVLSLLILLMLVSNSFMRILPVWYGPSDWQAIFVFGVTGLFVAQTVIVSLWSSLWLEPLMRRLTFLLSASVVALSALAIGFLLELDTSISLGNKLNDFIVGIGCAAPLCLISCMVPFLILRWCNRGYSSQPEVIGSGAASIAGIMLLTASIGVAFGGVEYLVRFNDVPLHTAWSTAGISAGCLICTSLVVALPLILIVNGGRLWVRIGVALLYAVLPGCISMVVATAIETRGSQFLPRDVSDPGVIILVIVLAFSIAIIWFAIAIRLMGFKLIKLSGSRPKN